MATATKLRFCASCGRTVDRGSRFCPYCGHDSQGHLLMTPQPRGEPIGVGIRILLYVLSFFIPLAGFIVGAIYMANPGPDHKHVGKICLILAAISFGALMLMILVGIMALFSAMLMGF